eukprot:TRINITY_DN36117_c0_g1_i1.p1 TRINITY_DN36117_c0_g1~~TRINITY_DN36117_c0_g1_i1.p1  ORF type:complete len:172 (+),score=23.14 TRINITY_DN36117_c0_g1_i1:27-518(+)
MLTNLVSHKTANRIRGEIVEEYAAKLTLEDDEMEKAKQKWFGKGLIEKLEEPTPEKIITAKCPKGHTIEAVPREKAWLCQGASKWKPRCVNGSHNGAARYSCTSDRCLSWDGLCEEHFKIKTQEAKDNEKSTYMTGFILNRYERPTRHISPPRPKRTGPAFFR